MEYKDDEPDEETGITGTYLDLDNRAITGGYPNSVPPKLPYVIPDVKPADGSEIIMLGSDKSLAWHMDGDNLVIDDLPEELPCDYAWSFKIKIR